jgi:hypothetical protein
MKENSRFKTCPLFIGTICQNERSPTSLTSHKFMGSVEKIFKNLPKPFEWRPFLNNGLPLLMDFCEDV